VQKLADDTAKGLLGYSFFTVRLRLHLTRLLS